ncbi:uncharacterized protein [Nicotiana tomentosiformis]|uniref:uncharacterized protein n=1 Tax=Nicotiana tomentosiformis TaxID=4098 RepID=UPI00388CE221
MVYSFIKRKISWILTTIMKLAFPSCSMDQSWCNICDMVERLRPIPRSIIILWQLLGKGRYKLNTYGSYIQGSGQAGAGGILRDHEGRLIMALAITLSCSSNNLAEAIAARFGTEWCLNNVYTEVDLELDSLIVVNMLKNIYVDNGKIKIVIDDTFQLLSQSNLK